MMGGGNAALREGRLADVAPTLLELMGLPQPAEMTGVSLLCTASVQTIKFKYNSL